MSMGILPEQRGFEPLAGLSREWLWQTDLKGKLISCSPGCEGVYGYLPEELLGRNPFSLVLPAEERAAQRKIFDRLKREKNPLYELRGRGLKKDGTLIDTKTHCLPVVTADQVIGVRGLTRNLGVRREGALAGREPGEAAQVLFLGAEDGALLIAPDGTILEANAVAAADLDAPARELRGRNLWHLLPSELAASRREAVRQLLATGTPHRSANRQNGKWYDITMTPVRDGRGRITKISLLCRDITSQKELALRLEHKTRELTEVNNALKVLLQQSTEAIAAHERTIHENLHRLVFPYLEKIRAKINDTEMDLYLNVVQANLEKINSTFTASISSRLSGLTPRELQVAEFIKQGKTTKEMATLLEISARTVEFYRDKLRIKLGIKNRKMNLRSHLSSLI
ncbi:PAS domain-containing protein [Thiovibrio sp. JS02]